MRHETIAKALCGEYVRLSESSGYVASRMTMPRDGSVLGAYVVDVGAGRLRVTDDGDTLFRVAVTGVEITRSRLQSYQGIAAECGLQLAQGELHAVCDEQDAPYYVARLLEAGSRTAYASVGHRPRAPGRFERTVAGVLGEALGHRVTRNASLFGSSGHQLRFPFAIDINSTSGGTVIQTIAAASGGKLDWGNVYQAAGKFQDLLNNDSMRVRRVAVLEEADPNQIQQATTALAQSARVVVYRGRDHLLSHLRTN